MRFLPFTLMLLLPAAMAADIYKRVDANGNVQFSDRPFPGAEKIEVEAAQTYSAPTRPAVRSNPSGAPEEFKYERCAIIAPANDQVFLNESSASIAWQLVPSLRPGDVVQLIYDGGVMSGVSPGAMAFTIAPVFRGTHTVAVSVQDREGKVLCRSPEVTFHVRQPSVLSPGNPANRPRPQPR